MRAKQRKRSNKYAPGGISVLHYIHAVACCYVRERSHFTGMNMFTPADFAQAAYIHFLKYTPELMVLTETTNAERVFIFVTCMRLFNRVMRAEVVRAVKHDAYKQARAHAGQTVQQPPIQDRLDMQFLLDALWAISSEDLIAQEIVRVLQDPRPFWEWAQTEYEYLPSKITLHGIAAYLNVSGYKVQKAFAQLCKFGGALRNEEKMLCPVTR